MRCKRCGWATFTRQHVASCVGARYADAGVDGVTPPVTDVTTDVTHNCPDCGAPHTVRLYDSPAEKQRAYRERQKA